MPDYHRLLLRQLERLGLEAQDPALDERCRALLDRVSRAYEDADKSQYLLRRAQDLSSQEIGHLYTQLKEAQRVAGLGNWTFEAATRQGQWSEECARTFGIDPARRIPSLRELMRRLHERSRPSLARAVVAALREGRAFELELCVLRDDGRACWVGVAGRAACDAEGTVQRLHGTLMDITRRKLTELRQTLEHTVTQLLAEAHSPLDAMPRVLETMVTTLGWVRSVYWQLDAAPGMFRRQASYAAPGIPSLVQATDTVPAGDAGALIARTADAGMPTWVIDIANHGRFALSEPAAVQAGLRAAMAFPIHAASKVVGVIELFDKRAQPPDADLMDSAQSLGRQIGQFLHRKQAEDRIHHLAFHDPLTGLPNRAMFNQHLSQAIAQAVRHSKRLAVLFIDLDRFKVINDTLGHDAGDRLLQEMAGRLSAILREGDVLARLGGDEFVVLIEEMTDTAQVAHVARRLLDALLQPYRLAGHPVHVTGSIGVALFPEDGEDQRTLMKHADIAMYRAKEAGKNNCQFYSAQTNPHSQATLALESDLRYALQRGELRLHYQPRLELGNNRISGAEALVRWEHPVLGLLNPVSFVPLAEETGLIVPLGQWVLDHACAQHRQWSQQGLPPVCISVNLSARQFGNERLIEEISACLSRHCVPASMLEIEVTESAVMHNPDKVVHMLEVLRRLGVRVAIDDFGVGYSSLAQLKRLPIDIIKIDRSFIDDCPEDAADVAITQAIIGIGRSLGLQVVAEGVETARQLRFVRDSGCNEVQGFLFSKPLPADDFAALRRRSLDGTAAGIAPLAGVA